MAFGFVRQAGTSRRYINVSNPDLPIGTVLADRQYRKFLERIGERTHLPTVNVLRQTERDLEELQKRLNARERDLDARERDLIRQQVALAAERLEAQRKGFTRLTHNKVRQRRYDTLLDLYRQRRAEEGKPLGKREAMRDPAFKEMIAAIRETDKKRRNPNADAQRKIKRRSAFALVGGAEVFRDQYEAQYGKPARRSQGRGMTIRRRNKG